jgi:hypothetical protein
MPSPRRVSLIVVTAALLLGAGLDIKNAEAGALHGFCVAPTPTCSDNGQITPTTSTSPDFGFLASPNNGSATFYLEALIPNDVSGAGTESFSITGTNTANAVVSSVKIGSSSWTTGQLDSYLGISASPANPIGAFLPLTQGYDPSATGYVDYQFDFGNVTFGSVTDPTFSTDFSFPEGTIITAFADTVTTSCKTHKGVTTCTDHNDWTATANSAALIIDSPPPTPVPEPSSAPALVGSLMLFAFAVRRRAE